MSAPPIKDFHEPITVGSAGIKLPVYVSDKGTKPLVVLHELPGTSPSFICYCKRMAGEGYKIYMPLLFKSPNTEMNRLQCGLFCISREFRALFSASRGKPHERPFTAWLIELFTHVCQQNPNAKIGVVGMCLTGGFSIAAIAAPNVNAAIVCQPSVPFFFHIKTLGLSDGQRHRAVKRAGTLILPCAKGYRFKDDPVSRDAHMVAAQELLGAGAFERYPDLPGKDHSTLTTKSYSPEVYDDVLEFLNSRL